MSMFTPDILALADLLKPNEDSDTEIEEDYKKYSTASLGPGNIGTNKAPPSSDVTKPDDSNNNEKEKQSQLWKEFNDPSDTRSEPQYDIVYKQAVTSEDMFLQMGNKTPLTSSCESMLVKIQLPDVTLSEIDLDIHETFLACKTPKHKLGLHLPHPVDKDEGKAQWDGKTSLLTVTLKMKREYDFVNY